MALSASSLGASLDDTGAVSGLDKGCAVDTGRADLDAVVACIGAWQPRYDIIDAMS